MNTVTNHGAKVPLPEPTPCRRCGQPPSWHERGLFGELLCRTDSHYVPDETAVDLAVLRHFVNDVEALCAWDPETHDVAAALRDVVTDFRGRYGRP